jgi:hypothetical protein
LGNIHTHYDNLKVTRNAPPEVIRAAYKTLTQKYHPDRHPGSADAERVMALINVSYHVLSDPVQRAEHDRWITQQEQMATPAPSSPWPRQPQQPPPQATPHSAQPPMPTPATVGTMGGLVSHVLRNWLWYGIAGVVVWSWATSKPSIPPVGPKPYQTSPAPSWDELSTTNPTVKPKPHQASPVPAVPTNVRPVAAPNGQPWPAAAGYVKGYQQLHTNGLSTVTVDNSRNDSEVFVKLVSLDSAQAYPVRQFYIPAFGSFTLKKVTAGSYDVRYRDLGSGGLSRSEALTLSEVHTDEGTRFSNVTMTLYKVKNGNMKTFGLPEAEF